MTGGADAAAKAVQPGMNGVAEASIDPALPRELMPEIIRH